MTVNTNGEVPNLAKGSVPALEPRFVIRAQDRFALPAIDAYRQMCIDNDLIDQAVQVSRAYVEVNRWQQAHPDLVKLPDHVHQPVSQV